LSKQGKEGEGGKRRRPGGGRAEEIASALRESAATPGALARRREKQLRATLQDLLESENRDIFVKRAQETFKLREDDPRWQAILSAWDAHVNP